MTLHARYTYCSWDTHAGNSQISSRHFAVLASSMDPWAYQDVIRIVNHVPEIQDFLKPHNYPYFIVPCPPTKGIDPTTHPLVRQAALLSKRRPGDNRLYQGSWSPSRKSLRHRGNNYTGDDWLEPYESEEWRFLVIPTIDAILSRELHSSTLNFTFIMVYQGVAHEFTYKDLWKHCPIINAVFQNHYESSCPNCDIRGPECVFQWFQEELKERVSYADSIVFLHGDRTTRLGEAWIDGDTIGISAYRWKESLKKIFKTAGKMHIPRSDTPREQLALPGYESTYQEMVAEFIGPGLSRSEQQNMFMKAPAYTPAMTSLDPERIEENRKDYSQNAQKAAETRKNHNKVCGSGDDACFLKCQGCTRWETNSWRPEPRCKQRWSEPDELLEAGVEAFKEEIDWDEGDFEIAMVNADTEITCINPDTNRTIGAYYGGLAIEGGRMVHRITRATHSDAYDLVTGSWPELRQWIRRWSPWNEEVFYEWEKRAEHTTVDDPARVFYAEVANIHSIWQSGGFGGGHYENLYVSASAMFGKGGTFKGSDFSLTMHAKYGKAMYFREPDDIPIKTGWRSWFRWVPS